jgi:hypothetical protein
MLRAMMLAVLLLAVTSPARAEDDCVLYVPGFPDTVQAWGRFVLRMHAEERIAARPVVVPVPGIHTPGDGLFTVHAVVAALEVELERAAGGCGRVAALVTHDWGSVLAARWGAARGVYTIALDVDAAVSGIGPSLQSAAYHTTMGYAPEFLVRAFVQQGGPGSLGAQGPTNYASRRIYRMMASEGRTPGPASRATHALLFSSTMFTSDEVRSKGYAFEGGHWFFMLETREGARARRTIAHLLAAAIAL